MAHLLARFDVSPKINNKSRVNYPGPGFLSSTTRPLKPLNHFMV